LLLDAGCRQQKYWSCKPPKSHGVQVTLLPVRSGP
jgi:hypothetical protein